MAANGLSGLTATFYPVIQASLNKLEQFQQVTKEVGDNAAQIISRGVQAAASETQDVSAGVLTGRGQKVDIQI
jgi:hypothetical protein